MGKRRSSSRINSGSGGPAILAAVPTPQEEEADVVISIGTPSVRVLSIGAGVVIFAAMLAMGGLSLIL